jgi:monothiol glutaredoxin
MSDPQQRISEMVTKNTIVLFMKGTRTMPQCGFSARAISVLEHIGSEYLTFDVLSDPDIRQGVKDFANWPTIPQLYINGEFIGGSDIIMQMFETGELAQTIAKDES